MKKILFSLGVMLSAFALTNCTQEIENPAQQPESVGYPFEIVASTADTKTVNDGMSTKWVEGDQINLFYAEAGTTEYKNNAAFSVAEEDVAAGRFTGTLVEDLTAEAYDWYAFYPYTSYMISPDGAKGYVNVGLKSQTQTGNNDMSHLSGENCPMVGVLKNIASSEKPAMDMTHLTSVVKVHVANNTKSPLTISNVSFKGTERITGTFYIDFRDLADVYYKSSGDNYTSTTATLKVEDGEEIAVGSSADFYLAVKPFTAESGSLVVSVNGYERSFDVSSPITFTAGKIKTLNFNYDKEPVELDAISLPWFEDFTDCDVSKYTLTHGETKTKVYEGDTDNLAGGNVPELLISKGNGSFSAIIATDGYVGVHTLTFKCNYPERITVTSPTDGVEVSKDGNTDYLINVTKPIEKFEVTFSNTTNNNARIDDIFLVKGEQQSQTLTFEKSAISLFIGSDEAKAFTGQFVQGANTKVIYSSDNESVAEVNSETGIITLKDVVGSATITAKAVATEEYKEARATYIIALDEKGDGVAKQYTFTITKDDFNSTSYAANNNEKTSIATADDGSTTEVKWTSCQVMNQNSTMQWQKSKGYIYNSTNLGTIDDIVINSTSGTFSTYIGPGMQPTLNEEGGYFQIKVGSATGKITEIKITFTK